MSTISRRQRGQRKSGSAWLQQLAFASLALTVYVLGSSNAIGAGDAAYIAPVSSDRPHRIVVIGDSVGANMADGLKWTFRKGDNLVVRKHTRAGTGLIRTDRYNWPRALRRVVRKRRPDIIVMLIGGNDRQDVRVRGRRQERFSKGWRAEYVRRIEKFASMLADSGAAVYWVGLPGVRSGQMSRDYVRFNRYYRAASRKYGLKFVEIGWLFADANGRYSDYGRDLRNKRARLRDRDGIHLTNSGSKKLGRYIGDLILDDMPRRSRAKTALRAQATD